MLAVEAVTLLTTGATGVLARVVPEPAGLDTVVVGVAFLAKAKKLYVVFTARPGTVRVAQTAAVW
jgi:hypothetical protein